VTSELVLQPRFVDRGAERERQLDVRRKQRLAVRLHHCLRKSRLVRRP